MLRNMQITGEFEHYTITQELWGQQNISYDVISATMIPATTDKFEIYILGSQAYRG